MNRKEYLKGYIEKACKSSSIYYNGLYRSIKLNEKTGEIFFVEKSRKLDIVKITIPNYDWKKDIDIIFNMINDKKIFKMCESDDEYVSIMYLINEEVSI